MKAIYFIIILFVTYTSSAQDPRLFGHSWYLEKIIIDGEDHYPPSPNMEVPYVPLHIAPDYLETSVCDTGDGAITFSLIDSSFFFIHGMAITLGNCYIPDNYPFQVIYFNGFFDSNYITQDDIFQYEIMDSGGGILRLTLTSPRGDQAIYGDAILAVNDNQEIDFIIFPNPASEELVLKYKNNLGSIKVQIFNADGKVYKNYGTNTQANNSIDISELATGLYFLKIETESGQVEVKKFLKE